jgi:hypothetical protein
VTGDVASWLADVVPGPIAVMRYALPEPEPWTVAATDIAEKLDVWVQEIATY